MLYHNPKTIKTIKELIYDMTAYAQSLFDEYKSKLDCCTFMIVTDADSVSNRLRKLLFYSYAVTDSTAYVSQDADPKSAEYNKLPIIQVRSNVYISENTVLGFLCDYDFDFKRIQTLFQFVIRHEIGHCIDHARFVGKPLSEFKLYNQKIKPEITPSEYSLAAALSNYLAYHSRPQEKAANDAIGITESDIEKFVRALVGSFYD